MERNQQIVRLSGGPTTQRYFRLNFTANSGWPAAQLSEFQIWNS
ncbi:MAG: hypothetical protein QOC85_3850 [Streptomyces sp.]|nr:hypothetical protein [Streptomyces sp.]